jgi:hypothetical protein
MLGMPVIGQRFEQFGVAVGAAAVFRRTGSLTTDTRWAVATAAEYLDFVLPPVAEVVGVDEPPR